MFKTAITENINEKNVISIDIFLDKIKNYPNLDQALLDLSDEYFQFYIDNQKVLDKTLKKMHMLESEITLGTSPTQEVKYKNIKYKGEYITLVYDPLLGSWFPTIRFRSIVNALKYIKNQADELL